MPLLNRHSSVLIHNDALSATNNPFKRFVDWVRHWVGITVENPDSQRFAIPANSSSTVFSGTRTLTIDGTTTFSLALNSYITGQYRLTATAGTVPGFRTDRGLVLSGSTITVAVNNNATATFTCAPVGGFAGVIVGDIVFVPHTTTGDSASPLNADNTGFWQVLANTSNTTLTLRRLTGESFLAAAEALIAITDNSQLQAFSSSGVQIGDTLEISAGFSTVTQKSYILQSVTANRIEFVSTESLPLETGIVPGAAGITIYSNSKRYLKIEADQECAIRLNGDTGNTIRLQPLISGDLDQTAFLEKWGPTWSLVIVNRSSSVLNVDIITAE